MRSKIFEVLGLGPSLKYYDPEKCLETIGVNDICAYHKVDHLLLMDPPSHFNEKRLNNIKNSKPKTTFSNLMEWEFMPGFQKIKIAGPEHGGDVSSLDDWECLPRHVDSTFTAVCLAYHFDANDIILHGVDFKNHNLAHYSDQIIRAYSKLHAALIQRGIMLWVGSDESLLSKFIPNWNELDDLIF
ncbi:hypothetical protein ES705_06389 [subsurface metagenome]